MARGKKKLHACTIHCINMINISRKTYEINKSHTMMEYCDWMGKMEERLDNKNLRVTTVTYASG